MPLTMAAMIGKMPRHLKPTVSYIARDSYLGAGITEMQNKEGEIKSTADLFAGIWFVPEARRMLNDRLDSVWKWNGKPLPEYQEVIVGGGLQAAVYASVRAKLGHPRPLVIEEGRVGGSFAWSKGPAFYLNSRNRAGSLSVPGLLDGSLNTIPEAPVQAAHLGMEEYSTNEQMAFAIRMALAMHADVISGVQCGYRVRQGGRAILRIVDENISTPRAIFAQGLGTPRRITDVRGALLDSPDRLINFKRFVEMTDQHFPFRDWKRVAVIGAGDGAKTVIEALTGFGPSNGMQSAAMNTIEALDWYGIGDLMNAQVWVSQNRSRYRPLSTLLPDPVCPSKTVRVTPEASASNISLGYDCVYINGVPYDHVVDCIGYYPRDELGDVSFKGKLIGGRQVAQVCVDVIYKIGVGTGLSLEPAEGDTLNGVPENITSAFRYNGRTALLAATLP